MIIGHPPARETSQDSKHESGVRESKPDPDARLADRATGGRNREACGRACGPLGPFHRLRIPTFSTHLTSFVFRMHMAYTRVVEKFLNYDIRASYLSSAPCR